jgi:5,10-methylenetetrahydrofolate reductase
MLWDVPYIIEILTPRKSDGPPGLKEMERFARRYEEAISAGCAVSIPDNPLGNLRYSALETFDQLKLQVDGEKTLLNLNTFHTKSQLDSMLEAAASRGLRYLLVVRGDGSPDLPKLQPQELGADVNMVTSIELLRYINSIYDDVFCTGAAFNQYKPQSVERTKLVKKTAAGARFLVVQPVMGEDSVIAGLLEEDIPVVLEAWMSPRIELFVKSVKGNAPGTLDGFDPVKNLAVLHELYTENCVYLSMLHSLLDWQTQLPRL